MTDLFDKPATRQEQIEEAAIQFDSQHPKVRVLFDKFTFEAINRGFAHYSANAIFERIRWETDEADEDGKSTFKINNNFRPYFARWFMDDYPEYGGFFRIRELTSGAVETTGWPELTPSDYSYV